MICVLGHTAVEGIRKAYNKQISVLPQSIIDDYVAAGFKDAERVLSEESIKTNNYKEKLKKSVEESRQLWNFVIKSSAEQIAVNEEMAVENAI